MMRSLFILNKDREVLLEKHGKTVTPRSVLDYLCEGQSKLTDLLKIAPIAECPNNVLLVVVEEKNVFFVAVCCEEAPPLFIIEFLKQVVYIIEDYFGGISESVIVDNIVYIFELLDEMLDNGFPLATEPNILKELIKPPKLLRSIAEVVTGRTVMGGNVTSTLPANQLSNTRWRRAGVKYTSNEAFFDVTERINAIIDRSGNVLLAEAEGSGGNGRGIIQVPQRGPRLDIPNYVVGLRHPTCKSLDYRRTPMRPIDCTVLLSGMPDLTMSFNNPRLLEEVSLHPCVRYFRWEKQRILSFVPPDGKFRLFSYFIPNLSNICLPIALRHTIQVKEVGGRIELSVSPKSTGGKPLESVRVSVLMPAEVSSCNVTTTFGKSSFDTVTKTLTWDIGSLETRNYPVLKGTITTHSGCTEVSTTPVVNLYFDLPQTLVSGIRVTRLELHAEGYKSYKGIKYTTISGNFEVRV